MDGQSASFHGVVVLASAASWSALYGILNVLQPKRSRKWNARVIACIHGATVTLMSIVFGFWCNPSPFTDPGGVSNFYEVLIQVTCFGFFAFETIFCLRLNVYGQDTSIMAVHHVICMIGLMTSLTTGMSGTELSAVIGLGECTNPMFHFRWFMRERGLKKNNFWFQVNDAAFVIGMFTARGMIWPYLTYCEITHPRPTNIVKYLALSFTAINVFFLVGILEFACRRCAAVFAELSWGRCQKSESKSEDNLEGITLHKTFGDVLSRLVSRWKMTA